MKKQEGFQSYRTADRRGDHLSSGPSQFRTSSARDGGERGFGGASLRTINTGEVTYNNTYPGSFAEPASYWARAGARGIPSSAECLLVDQPCVGTRHAGTARAGTRSSYQYRLTYSTDAEPGVPWIDRHGAALLRPEPGAVLLPVGTTSVPCVAGASGNLPALNNSPGGLETRTKAGRISILLRFFQLSARRPMRRLQWLISLTISVRRVTISVTRGAISVGLNARFSG